jgi:hypothetical protein
MMSHFPNINLEMRCLGRTNVVLTGIKVFGQVDTGVVSITTRIFGIVGELKDTVLDLAF